MADFVSGARDFPIHFLCDQRHTSGHAGGKKTDADTGHGVRIGEVGVIAKRFVAREPGEGRRRAYSVSWRRIVALSK